MDVSELSALLPGPVGRTPTVDDSDSTQASAASDFDAFLTLLTAQLENQDPLSPLDATEFVAQLASFSSVEQLVGVNDRLDASLEQTAASDSVGMAAWIGQDAMLTSGVFKANGQPVDFGFEPAPAGQIARARVVDTSGTAIAEFAIDNTAAGRSTWDGKTSQGELLQDRDVKIEVDYIDGGTVANTSIGWVSRTISAIRGTPDGLVLDFTDGGWAQPEEVAGLALAQK